MGCIACFLEALLTTDFGLCIDGMSFSQENVLQSDINISGIVCAQQTLISFDFDTGDIPCSQETELPLIYVIFRDI